jgi:hypothetical protein
MLYFKAEFIFFFIELNVCEYIYIYIYWGWKNNADTTDAVHIILLIWCWTTFSLQYSRNPSWNGLVQLLNSL